MVADLQQFGMQLKDEETGELARADPWEPQYDNLATSSHNYLRISRILKCLGELGFEKYPVSLVFATLRLGQISSGRLHSLHLESAVRAQAAGRLLPSKLALSFLGQLQSERGRATG
jgi:hypothetical protein